MSKSKKVKLEAKSHLRRENNWLIAIIIAAAMSLCSSIFSIFIYIIENIYQARSYMLPLENMLLSIFFIVAFIVLINPLALGAKRWFYKVAIGESPSISEVFYYFKKSELFARAISTILIKLRILLYYLVCLIPGLILMGITVLVIIVNIGAWSSVEDLVSVAMIILFVITLNVALIFLARYLTLRYFLAEYFVVSNDYISISNSIKFSVKATKGHKFSIFKLFLSFFFWELLCIFTLPVFYVYPYMQESLAVSAKWLIQKYQQDNISTYEKLD